MPDLIRFFKKLIATLVIALLPVFAHGYQFSSLASNLSESIKQNGIPLEKLRIALLFKVTNKNEVQKRFNLVELKRDLANELVQHYQMTDPLIVARILKINTLKFDDLENNQELIAKVGKKAEASHLALAHFQILRDQLVLDFRLVDLKGDKKGHIQLVVPPQEKKLENFPQNQGSPQDIVRTQRSISVSESTDNFFQAYKAPQINDQLNDSWVYFFPTAFLNPQTNFLELSFWPKDLENTDIILVQARYDFTVKRFFTLGSLSYGNEDGEYHSHYAYSKIRIFESSPFKMAIGLKKRLVWNSDNTDFKSDDEDIDKKNLNRNDLTLQGMASGWYDNLGLIWNLYIDNQNFSLGGKLLLTSEIKLIVESVLHYYENARQTIDHVLGIQFNNLSGGVSTLSYQSSNDQARLAIGFSW